MKLREWLEQYRQELVDIKISQVEMQQDLKHHIKRTNLLEDSVTMMREEIAPIKTHVAIVGAIAKSAIIVIGAIASLVAIYKALF